ncbi:unnamed protein product, partial [Cyprideis torosa]
MARLHFILHHLPGSEDQLLDRLREVSERFAQGGGAPPSPISFLDESDAVDIVVGPSHLAFLLSDGRVARVAYNLTSETVEQLRSGESGRSKSSSTGGRGPSPRLSQRVRRTGGSGAGSGGGGTRGGGSSAVVSAASFPLSGRSGRSSISSAGGVIVGSSRALVPATYVPEDLINQAAQVLQGKSRSIIIRELQRTNLDVNSAVNNLLSREEDESEGDGAGASDEHYVSDDLISLLDAGLTTDHPSMIIDADAMFSDELYSRRTSNLPPLVPYGRRTSRSPGDCPPTGSGREERSWRERRGDSLASGVAASTGSSAVTRWLDIMTKDEKSERPVQPVWLSSEVEWWTLPPAEGETEGMAEEMNEPVKFSGIAALYSELVAVTRDGVLCQWKWSSRTPHFDRTQ